MKRSPPTRSLRGITILDAEPKSTPDAADESPAARKTRERTAGNRLLPKLLLSAFSTIVLLGILEAAAFLWERGQAAGPYAWELVASRRIELVEFPAPGYTLLAPGSGGEWGGIAVAVNSHGLREAEFTSDKPEDAFRILNLGDSIAMGWGVAYEETYGRLLQEMLGAGAPGSGRFEVINAGVPGWNLENELAWLIAEGLELHPDAVILDLTLVNDIYGENALDRNNRPAPVEWLDAHSYLFPFIRVQTQFLESRLQGRERIPVLSPPTNARSYFPLDAAAERWDELWDLILEIERAAASQGIPLVLVMFPLEFQVIDDGFPTTPQQVFLARAGEAGIPIVDLLAVFRKACAEKPDGPCELEDRYLFADLWMHPSPLGHRLTAETLLPVLVELFTRIQTGG